MKIFRIADARHPLWDGGGAALFGGRWNSPGRPVIYASTSYACAMLEILVHANVGLVPKHHKCVSVVIPHDVVVKRHEVKDLPVGWANEESIVARAMGDRWLDEAKSAVLLIPSVVAPLEMNALVNPLHPDAQRLLLGDVFDVIWDKRLFGRH